MSNTFREKASVFAILLGVTLAFSVFSNAYATSSVSNLPSLSRELKLSSTVVKLDDDDNEDDHGSASNHGKGYGNNQSNGDDEKDKSDNGNGKKNGHTKCPSL